MAVRKLGNSLREAGVQNLLQAVRELVKFKPLSSLPRLWRSVIPFAPAFDVKESDEGFVVKADLPGFREQDLDIAVGTQELTISGTRNAEPGEVNGYAWRERSHGPFTRSFRLPTGIDAEQVDAEMTEGVLTLHVPKVAPSEAKRVPVRGNPA